MPFVGLQKVLIKIPYSRTKEVYLAPTSLKILSGKLLLMDSGRPISILPFHGFLWEGWEFAKTRSSALRSATDNKHPFVAHKARIINEDI